MKIKKLLSVIIVLLLMPLVTEADVFHDYNNTFYHCGYQEKDSNKKCVTCGYIVQSNRNVHCNPKKVNGKLEYDASCFKIGYSISVSKDDPYVNILWQNKNDYGKYVSSDLLNNGSYDDIEVYNKIDVNDLIVENQENPCPSNIYVGIYNGIQNKPQLYLSKEQNINYCEEKDSPCNTNFNAELVEYDYDVEGPEPLDPIITVPEKQVDETEPEKNQDEQNISEVNFDYDRPCDNESVLKVMKILGTIVQIAKIVAPLLIIIFGMIDYFRAVISDDEKATGKATEYLIKRIISGILIFIAAPLLLGILNFVGVSSSGYGKCTTCILDVKKCGKAIINDITCKYKFESEVAGDILTNVNVWRNSSDALVDYISSLSEEFGNSEVYRGKDYSLNHFKNEYDSLTCPNLYAKFDYDSETVILTLSNKEKTDYKKGTLLDKKESLEVGTKIYASKYVQETININDTVKKENTSSDNEFLSVAKKTWLKIVDGDKNFRYTDSNTIPLEKDGEGNTCNCSSYVSEVIYNYGYRGWAGDQKSTRYLMETNLKDLYGWEEYVYDGRVDLNNLVKPGDIVVRYSKDVGGHTNIVASITNGIAYAYDCGSDANVAYRKNLNGVESAGFYKEDIKGLRRKSKIIRVNRKDKNNIGDIYEN